MIEYVLWLALGLMLISSVIPKNSKVRKLIGGAGWGIFSIHWFYQPLHYIEAQDYANVGLTLVFALFCVLVAYIMFKEYREGSTFPCREFSPREGPAPGNLSPDISSMLTSACALGALVYFPFANVPSLNTWIISGVASQVVWILQVLGAPAVNNAWNLISLNGQTVEIILACTAIESIALFMGLIAAVKAPVTRLAAAFLVSVPVIYVLNLIRDVFVVLAYGGAWFGPDSFVIAHNYIAKAGSGIALFAISYAVLRILPEVLEMIDGLWYLLSGEVKSILNRFRDG